MSERAYLISKAERNIHGNGAPAAGQFLFGPPGAAAGGAIAAPKGKKGRAAVGAGLGGAAGMVPGAALAMSGAKASLRPVHLAGGRKRLALAGPTALAGGLLGAQGGYSASQSIGSKKRRQG